MNERELRQFWLKKFRELRKAENDAIRLYSRLLRKNRRILKGTITEKHLLEIIKDEKKHSRIAERLILLAAKKAQAAPSAPEAARAGEPADLAAV